MVSGKGLRGVVNGKSSSGGFCPQDSRGSTHLLSSGLQRVQVAASDVNCSACLAELQSDAPANTPGGPVTTHTWPFMVAGMTQQANGLNLWNQGLALREACRLRYSEGGDPDRGRKGAKVERSFDGERSF